MKTPIFKAILDVKILAISITKHLTSQLCSCNSSNINSWRKFVSYLNTSCSIVSWRCSKTWRASYRSNQSPIINLRISPKEIPMKLMSRQKRQFPVPFRVAYCTDVFSSCQEQQRGASARYRQLGSRIAVTTPPKCWWCVPT